MSHVAASVTLAFYVSVLYILRFLALIVSLLISVSFIFLVILACVTKSTN